MDALTLILTLSAIIWYVVDRLKPVWMGHDWSKYITTAAAGALGTLAVFGYNLDIIMALGLTSQISLMGKIITILGFMCGSSAISEIIARIKNKQI